MSSIANISTANRTRLVLVGATGMVGGYALRCALENPLVATVTAIGRRKLKEVLHGDFMETSRTVPHLRKRSRVRMQRCFVWAPIPEPCRLRIYAR
jgi:hypothetical protein